MLGDALPLPLELGLKALAGGVMVTLFALIGQALEPKKFAGLLAAAPAVALASLALVILTGAANRVPAQSTGMIAGAVGMILYCVAASFLVGRIHALLGSLISLVAWLAGAGATYLVLAR